MLPSKNIGIVVAVAVVLTAVTIVIAKNYSPSYGITIHQPGERHDGGVRADAESLRRLLGPSSSAAPSPPAVRAPNVSSTGIVPADQSTSAPEIIVQVAGAVRKPGVYHLRSDARNDDAVIAAGGLAANANAASVNLAAHAIDGSQLYVKTMGEQPTGGFEGDTIAAGTTRLVHPTSSPPRASPHSRGSTNSLSAPGFGSRPAKLKNPSEGKVNINVATSADLQKISGIGPAMAEKIIAFRQENHGFRDTRDLLQISGVGPKKFAKWEPYIRVR